MSRRDYTEEEERQIELMQVAILRELRIGLLMLAVAAAGFWVLIMLVSRC